jgi:glycylpeptide N-tetradecanoyltransferase
MEAGDVKAVTVLLQAYLSKFHCAPSFDEAEVAHWFLPRENIINSFVVQASCNSTLFVIYSFNKPRLLL